MTQYVHTKDVIGVLDTGYSTHIPIGFTRIGIDFSGSSEPVAHKGGDVQRAFPAMAEAMILFEGLLPRSLEGENEFLDTVGTNSTFTNLSLASVNHIPVSLLASVINTNRSSFRSSVGGEESLVTQVVYRGRSADLSGQLTGTLVDIIFLGSGYIDQCKFIAEAGEYIVLDIKLRADELYLGSRFTERAITG